MHVAHSSVLFVQTLLNKTICQKKSEAIGTALDTAKSLLISSFIPRVFYENGNHEEKRVEGEGAYQAKKSDGRRQK